MAVTPNDVATELGRPTPLDATTVAQWQSWIDRAVRLIERRAAALSVDYLTLDEQTVDDVVLLAVVEYARNPEGVDTYDISVDDGRESRRYRHSTGRITITDEWWGWLFPGIGSGAFSTQTYGAPDGPHVDRWPFPTGSLDWS